MDAHSLSCFSLSLKFHHPLDKSKERVIAPQAYVEARVKFCAPLANKNAARRYTLPAEPLDTESLSIAVSPVP